MKRLLCFMELEYKNKKTGWQDMAVFCRFLWRNAKYDTYLSFCDTLEEKKKLYGILCLAKK